MSKVTEESFLKDISKHKMTILHEDGIYRHIKFSQPGTNCYRFDLITWPGYLCYTGDMGTYTFWRTDDMFEFFRTDRRDKEDRLYINLGYWMEKIEATDKNDGHKEFSFEKFKDVINGYLEDADDELRQEVEDQIFCHDDNDEHSLFQAAYEFEHNGFSFQDLFEHSFDVCTTRFVWCCYAIAYGVREYDRASTDSQTR